MTAIITLTTDFGAGSPYVAALKGVILGVNPSVRLVDISHSIAPQQVRQAAVALAESTGWFPPHTIHVVVVDPGVGTARRLIYARIGDQQYLAPDNGLLSLLAKRDSPNLLIELTNAAYWLPEVSNTFHGRDILSPVAAQLSLGLEPERLGAKVDKLQMLDWPEARRAGRGIEGVVLWIDAFGNLITNVQSAVLEGESPRVSCLGKTIETLSRTYGDGTSGQLIALIGSSGYLELAAVDGNAAQLLHATVGTVVEVNW